MIQHLATVSDCRDDKDECNSKLIPEWGCDDADVINWCQKSCGLCDSNNGDKGK